MREHLRHMIPPEMEMAPALWQNRNGRGVGRQMPGRGAAHSRQVHNLGCFRILLCAGSYLCHQSSSAKETKNFLHTESLSSTSAGAVLDT